MLTCFLTEIILKSNELLFAPLFHGLIGGLAFANCHMWEICLDILHNSIYIVAYLSAGCTVYEH